MDEIDLRDDGSYQAASRIAEEYQREAYAMVDILGWWNRCDKMGEDYYRTWDALATAADHWGQIAFARWIESPDQRVI